MDILKSNKKIVFFVMLFFVIFLLYRENERRKEEILKQNRINSENCYNDTIIIPTNNRIIGVPVSFWGKYQKKKLEGLKIEQIRRGKKILDVQYVIYSNNNKDSYKEIRIIKDSLSLHTRDSLIFTFSDNEKIILREFRNGGTYGSKKFLGCEWSFCIHDQDTIVLEAGKIRIFK
jgi:hypothetical protein